VTAGQAVRAPRVRRARQRPLRFAHRPAAARPRVSASWEVRSFVIASAAIVGAFVLVLLYLAQATAVSASGYEAQRLAAQRDELRRQNALLSIESARLESPARIEADAAKLGLVRAATIHVVAAEAVAAKP
jgi:hypothetical protein